MELIQAHHAALANNSSNLHNSESKCEGRKLKNHDYIDHSTNDLTVLSGTCLQVAECMGTGILALPYNISILGMKYGLLFLIINLPINFYAGNLLDQVAISVESYQFNKNTYQTINDEYNSGAGPDGEHFGGIRIESRTIELQQYEHSDSSLETNDTHTYDFIGLASTIFKGRSPKYATLFVMILFYLNLILVLGNYILVMSHAVQSFVGGEQICLPLAGVIASSLMFGLSLISTMARLGHAASIISLLSLAIVVAICLFSIEHSEHMRLMEQTDNAGLMSGTNSLLQKFAAISSIGFAVGSQKLFLNIRHEFTDRSDAPKSLRLSLIAFGIIYGSVCLFAGPNPPELLFDAIEHGVSRKIAGLMLWIHVAVSYSINSQALCSSIDRLIFYRVENFKLNERHQLRWVLLTFLTASLSYLTANTVPFFSDLVSLIGALTSVPLTLLLPAWFYRSIFGVPPLSYGHHNISSRIGSCANVSSLLLITYSLVFMVTGILGSIYCIQSDWKVQRAAFGC